MELIPILSLIILVATISTFFLSIGAYVLYKIREKKGKAQAEAKPQSIPAELITPQLGNEMNRLTDAGLRRTYEESQFGQRTTLSGTSPMFFTQDENTSRPEMRPTIISQTMDEETAPSRRANRTTVSAERFRDSSQNRFSRYTSTGYAEVDKKKKDDEEPLRWR